MSASWTSDYRPPAEDWPYPLPVGSTAARLDAIDPEPRDLHVESCAVWATNEPCDCDGDES